MDDASNRFPKENPGRGRPTVRDQVVWTALILAFAGWSVWFIYRTSFIVGGERYFSLFDDAMISMTYAKNLLEGHGLNWARWGEPVEGYTNPLWTFLMVPAVGSPLPARLQSVLVQAVGAMLLAGTALLATRFVREHLAAGRFRGGMPTAVLTLFYYPLAYWSLMGMETALVAFLNVAAVHLATRVAFDDQDRWTALWLVLAAAVLTRPDGMLLVAACLVTVGGRLRAGPARRWLPGMLGFVALVGGYLVFRGVYFGELLPNTYYLKLGGIPLSVRLARGTLTLWESLRPIFLPVAAVVVGAAGLVRHRPRMRLPLAVFALYLAYTVYVGGDAWAWAPIGANRFVSGVMPLLFALLDGLLNEGLAWRERSADRPVPDPARFYVRFGVPLLCFFLFNGLVFGDDAKAHVKQLLGLSSPLHVGDHEHHVRQTLELEPLLGDQAKVAVVWAGIPAFFSDFRMVDLLGYNDQHLAKAPPRKELDWRRPGQFHPGHDKWNYDYSLGKLKPDAVMELWHVPKHRIPRLLRGHGYHRRKGFWVRRDSPHVEGPR